MISLNSFIYILVQIILVKADHGMPIFFFLARQLWQNLSLDLHQGACVFAFPLLPALMFGGREGNLDASILASRYVRVLILGGVALGRMAVLLL
jgi:hypothetical protein